MQGARQLEGGDGGVGRFAGDGRGQVPHGGGPYERGARGHVEGAAVGGEGLADGVHDDGVLVQVLRGLQERGRPAYVLGEVGAAGGGAGERVGDEAPAASGDQQFGAGAEEGAAGAGGQGEGVAGRVAAGQALEQSRQVEVAGGAQLQGAGEDDLAEVAALHAAYGLGDGVAVAGGLGNGPDVPVGRGGLGGGQRDERVLGQRRRPADGLGHGERGGGGVVEGDDADDERCGVAGEQLRVEGVGHAPGQRGVAVRYFGPGAVGEEGAGGGGEETGAAGFVGVEQRGRRADGCGPPLGPGAGPPVRAGGGLARPAGDVVNRGHLLLRSPGGSHRARL